MADPKGAINNPEKWLHDTLAEIVSPANTIIYIGQVAMTVGSEIGIGYCIGGKTGPYFNKEEACANMQSGDKLYALRAKRIK